MEQNQPNIEIEYLTVQECQLFVTINKILTTNTKTGTTTSAITVKAFNGLGNSQKQLIIDVIHSEKY
jgi:hypothetical protein